MKLDHLHIGIVHIVGHVGSQVLGFLIHGQSGFIGTDRGLLQRCLCKLIYRQILVTNVFDGILLIKLIIAVGVGNRYFKHTVIVNINECHMNIVNRHVAHIYLLSFNNIGFHTQEVNFRFMRPTNVFSHSLSSSTSGLVMMFDMVRLFSVLNVFGLFGLSRLFVVFRLFVVSGLLGWWGIVMLMMRFGVMCRVFYSRGVLSLVGNFRLDLLRKCIAFSRRKAVPFFSSKCAIDIAMPVENASGSHLMASIGESISETKVLVNFGHMQFVVVSCIIIGIFVI